TDHRDDLQANRMFFRRVSMADGLERLIRSIPCPLDDRLPGTRVGILEAREQPNQRIPGTFPDAVVEREADYFVTAALEDLCIGHDLAHKSVTLTVGFPMPAVHALTRLAPFIPGRVALSVEGLLRGLRLHDQPAQIFG